MQKFDAESNTEGWITLAMFSVLSVVDLMLIFLLSIDQTEEGRIERGYFSGSFLFIDLPTLVGILAMMEIVTPVISPGFGVDKFSVVQAFFGGSLVMHIALAQIVLVFLIFRRKAATSVTVSRHFACRSYNAAGQRVSVTSSLDQTTQYQYDSANNLITIINANNVAAESFSASMSGGYAVAQKSRKVGYVDCVGLAAHNRG